MSQLKFHPRVETDLAETAEWYERQQPGLGHRFLDSAREAFRCLPQNAELYSVRFSDIRRLNIQRFPHGIFYFISKDRVVVLGIMHGARNLSSEVARRREGYG